MALVLILGAVCAVALISRANWGGFDFGGFIGGITAPVQDLVQSAKDTVQDTKSTLNEVKDTTKTLTVDLPVSLVKAAGVGGQKLLSDPKFLTQAGSAVLSGGATLPMGLMDAAGTSSDFSLPSMLAGLLGGGRPSGGVSVSVPSGGSSLPLPTPAASGVPVWAWIAGGVAAVSVVLLLVLRRGRK